jgi:hypothetical protein
MSFDVAPADIYQDSADQRLIQIKVARFLNPADLHRNNAVPGSGSKRNNAKTHR